jgi:hypothetical protein
MVGKKKTLTNICYVMELLGCLSFQNHISSSNSFTDMETMGQ